MARGRHSDAGRLHDRQRVCVGLPVKGTGRQPKHLEKGISRCFHVSANSPLFVVQVSEPKQTKAVVVVSVLSLVKGPRSLVTGLEVTGRQPACSGEQLLATVLPAWSSSVRSFGQNSTHLLCLSVRITVDRRETNSTTRDCPCAFLPQLAGDRRRSDRRSFRSSAVVINRLFLYPTSSIP